MGGRRPRAMGSALNPLLARARQNIDWEHRQLAATIVEYRQIRIFPRMIGAVCIFAFLMLMA
jgi:hypothetical protein